MENITLEQIDLIMKRANVTYTEAKEALQQCGGDTVEALIYLEKADKLKNNKSTASTCGKTFCESAKAVIQKLNATRFILRKEDKNFIDIPLSIALIVILFSCYISIVALIVAYCCGYRIRIVGENDIANKINEGMDFIKKQQQ